MVELPRLAWSNVKDQDEVKAALDKTPSPPKL